MFAKHAHLILPGVAVSIVYAAVFGIPQYRELGRVSAASQEHFAAVEELRLRVSAQQGEARRHHEYLAEVPGSGLPTSTTTHVVSLARDEQTFVQAFAEVLSIFQLQGVQCTTADPGDSDQGKNRDGVIVYRVSLIGSFRNVLAAMRVIEAKLPNVAAVELALKRPEPSDECRWRIAFRFEGAE